MRRYAVEVGGRTHVVDVEELTAERFRVRVGGHDFELKLSRAEEVPGAPVAIAQQAAGGAARAVPPPPVGTLPPLAPPPLPAAAGAAEVRAPMPGTVTSVEVRPGEAVRRGQTLARLEAMKMLNHVRAPRDGVVARVEVEAGATVGFGDVLLSLGPDAP
jgi:biotin carboxyl carrier protein